MGTNILFKDGGISLSSDSRLVLVNDQRIPLNNKVDLVFPGGKDNFVSFDCDGFKELSLQGNFEFDKGFLVPDPGIPDPFRTSPSGTGVTASLKIQTSDMGDMLIETSISPFQIRGLPGLGFSVQNATVDMSDLRNPEGFQFPLDYDGGMDGVDINLWRGFYLQEATVYLPEELSSSNRLTVQARHLVIDEAGVSGHFEVQNLLSVQDGKLGAWGFSIDAFSVTLVKNHLRAGRLEGSMQVPFLGNDPIGYLGEMEETPEGLNYRFLARIQEEKSYNFFGGKIYLSEGCTIGVERREGRLIPQALLHGRMELKKASLQVDKILFQNLLLVGEYPYVAGGLLSYDGGKAKMGGYGLQVRRVDVGIFQGEFRLGMEVVLNLMDSKDKGFSAETMIEVVAALEKKQGEGQNDGQGEGQEQRNFEFKGVRVQRLALETRTTAFSMKGELEFYDDNPVYGDGFRGDMQCSIAGVLKNIRAQGYFGSTTHTDEAGEGESRDFRYWQLGIYLPTKKIPIVPPLAMQGIIAGASYHMVQKQPREPDFTQLGHTQAEDSTRMGSFERSSDIYLPDYTAGLAFKAGITYIIGDERGTNGDAIFEVAFNRGGGIRYIQFDGSAYVMTSIDKRGSGTEVTTSAPVYGRLSARFDRENDTFHANVQTYLNAGGAITGIGPNHLMGEAVFHIDPQDWYVYVGRPSQMLGVSVAGLASARAYFMIGTKVEDLPVPPSEVQEIIGDLDLDFMRNENALASGRGFAAGAHLRVGVDAEFRPFFVNLGIGGGADVMLRKYGEGTYCVGRESQGFGIDGWYASGQAYVFLKGGVGIRFRRKRFTIAELGLAALLQAKLPNPTWMRGILAGKYRILGGLVKGKFNLKFTAGEECELVTGGSELGDMAVISELKPEQDDPDVSVFSAPQVAFNVSVGEELRMMNVKDEMHLYKVVLDEAVLLKDGKAQAGEYQWNANKDVLIFKTPVVLPELSKLTFKVKIHWEKKENGRWTVLEDQGAVDYETKEVSFTTGEEPDFVATENIRYSYPINRQYNFYKDEHKQGYMQLGVTQVKAFRKEVDGTPCQYLARFESGTGQVLETSLSYDDDKALITFAIPEDLQTETLYKFHFVRRPSDTGIESNLTRSETNTDLGDLGQEDSTSTVQTTSNDLTRTIAQKIEKNIYTGAFRSSRYATFGDKMGQVAKNWKDLFNVTVSYTMIIGKQGQSDESWDRFELQPLDEHTQALVQAAASPEGKWYRQTVYPWLYEKYGAFPIRWRTPDPGQPAPLRESVRWENISDQTEQGYMVEDRQLENGAAATRRDGLLLGYFLSFYTYHDYGNLRDQASAEYIKTGQASEAMQRILGHKAPYPDSYVDLKRGTYPVNIRYVLPGINRVTFEKTYDIKF